MNEPRESIDRASERILRELEQWRQSPEGRAAMDAAWEKQKSSMIERGLTPGPD